MGLHELVFGTKIVALGFFLLTGWSVPGHARSLIMVEMDSVSLIRTAGTLQEQGQGGGTSGLSGLDVLSRSAQMATGHAGLVTQRAFAAEGKSQKTKPEKSQAAAKKKDAEEEEDEEEEEEEEDDEHEEKEGTSSSPKEEKPQKKDGKK